MSRVNPEPAGYKPAPNIMREYDEWANNWLDALDFRDYCDEVHQAVTSIGIASIAAIQRRVVRRNDQGYLADALARLLATGAIRERNTVCRATYEVRELPEPPKERKFNGANRPRDMSKPDPSSFAFGRKITN